MSDEMTNEFPCCGGSDETPPEHTQDCQRHAAKAEWFRQQWLKEQEFRSDTERQKDATITRKDAQIKSESEEIARLRGRIDAFETDLRVLKSAIAYETAPKAESISNNGLMADAFRLQAQNARMAQRASELRHESDANKDAQIKALADALAFLMLHGDKSDGHDVYCACPAQTDRENMVHSTACAQGIKALRLAGRL